MCNVAIYTRLSKEDLDATSKSIENQIIGAKEYCINHQFNIVDCYIDDGYSGGNLDRPDLNRMLNDMKINKFDTIIIKDLSRLGRNFIQVGNLVEEVFPKSNIRLISINDNYDSKTYDDDYSIVIKILLNDYYLRECKKKAKQGALKRSTKGKMTTGGIYGYKYDENKELILDEAVCDEVKNIFDMCLNKVKNKEIINYLNSKKIPTPGYQNIINYNDNRYRVKEENYYNWTNEMLLHILKNIEYTGISINRKRIVKQGKVVKNDTPLIMDNTHVAIVDNNTFEQVQEELKTRTKIISNDLDNVRIKGLFICGCCVKPFTYDKNSNKYICRFCKIRYEANMFHEVVLLDIKNLIEEYLKNEKNFKNKFLNHILNTNDFKDFNKLKEEKIFFENKLSKLFSDSVEGNISDDVFNIELKEINNHLKELDKQLTIIGLDKYDKEIINKQYIEFVNKIKNIDCSDLELIRRCIKSVLIYNKNVLIKYL